MKHRNQMKRTYRSPLSSPTEVALELALLKDSGTMLLRVYETENINAIDKTADQPGGETYFEY